MLSLRRSSLWTTSRLARRSGNTLRPRLEPAGWRQGTRTISRRTAGRLRLAGKPRRNETLLLSGRGTHDCVAIAWMRRAAAIGVSDPAAQTILDQLRPPLSCLSAAPRRYNRPSVAG